MQFKERPRAPPAEDWGQNVRILTPSDAHKRPTPFIYLSVFSQCAEEKSAPPDKRNRLGG